MPEGAGDTPGVGAAVDTTEGDGSGTAVLAGAGVPLGMPGMGAIDGSAASAGVTYVMSSAAARERRDRSNDSLVEVFGILRSVVHSTRTAGFIT
jgi:hypothetical protein